MSDSNEQEDDDWPYLIFSSGRERYAVESSAVREIVRNNSIYPVPFVPSYVRGIINYYSTPVAAVDWFKYKHEVSKQLFPKAEEHGCFSGTVSWEGSIVPLIDLKAAVGKIRGDLEKS